ncbi:hypothetical protein LMG29542_03819 [Paraburkholderia humisilvae]|uniref:Uncharacterized protein n=1 Tax=Paraburkholderia humisilvae TaxID=627669 RepID=A0A6J5E1R1_9BURK|nr:hypothetical protein LMG29542_03819 [Paraburkholderia humisilvae]
MAILARRVVKVLLFIALFIPVLRFVHTYPLPMTNDEVRWWYAISGKFGIDNIEDFEDFWAWLTFFADFIVAIFVYMAIMRFWRKMSTHFR